MPERAQTVRPLRGAAAATYRRAESRIRERLDVARAVVVAAVCLLGLAATWLVSAFVPSARFKDAAALHKFTLLSRPRVDWVAQGLVHVLEPVPFTILAAALVVVALLRWRRRVALAVACVMTLAPLSSELLKPLLAHAHDRVGGTYIAAASWPSGHATAAAAVALCAVLVAPRRLRPAVAAIGLTFALGVGCSLLILAWHMPSDVIGGYLVATLWMAVAVAALGLSDPSRSRARARVMTARA